MNLKTKTNTVKQILAKVMIAILLVVSVISFSSCTPKVELAKPENTNLEYWLLDSIDADNCVILEDLGGGTIIYLAEGYELVLAENGKMEAPQYAVKYYVSNYPLADLGVNKRISRIEITDPEINVWGLRVNSTREEIIATLEKNGFNVTQNDQIGVSGENGRYHVGIRFGESIYIFYETPSIIAGLWSIDFD